MPRSIETLSEIIVDLEDFLNDDREATRKYNQALSAFDDTIQELEEMHDEKRAQEEDDPEEASEDD